MENNIKKNYTFPQKISKLHSKNLKFINFLYKVFPPKKNFLQNPQNFLTKSFTFPI